MTIHRVSDKGSNAPENIELAVKVIGRSRIKRAVFKSVHTGRKQRKSVDEIADETREGRQQVLDAANSLSQHGLIHGENQGRNVVYRKDPFYQANRDRILRLVDDPSKLAQLETKRGKASTAVAVLHVPVRRKTIQAHEITIDDIQSFFLVRGVQPAGKVTLSEAATKRGLLKIIGDTGVFNDWGGERNDFLTDRLLYRGRRYSAAFALKGPGQKGLLTPGKMGKNGDQIQRLARSPSRILLVQYHAQIGDEVREQLCVFAQTKSVMEERKIWYGLIDGDDTSRLVAAYPEAFA